MLLQKKTTENTKNFYTSNNFFQIVITRFTPTFFMQDILYLKISKLKTWLFENDWSKIAQIIKNKYLDLFKTIKF